MIAQKPTDIYLPNYLPQIHPSTDVLDSSKIKDFKRCKRFFFFRHYLGWKPQRKELNLIFGRAWHLAKEFIWKFGINDPKNYAHAFQLFEQDYMKDFTELEDQQNFPKNRRAAQIGLRKYFQQFGSIPSPWSYIASEVWGDLILEGEKTIRFKVDLIVFDKSIGKMMVIDHKTSGTTRDIYSKLYQHSFQMLCYIFAVKSYYKEQNVGGLWIEESKFINRKTEDLVSNHERILVFPSDQNLSAWRHRALVVYDEILKNFEMLAAYDAPQNQYLTSFDKNEESCTAYGRLCPFFHECQVANPLILPSPPAGKVIDFWDPKEEGD